MEKLTSIASIVIDVGEACRTRGLVEEDLPDGLRTILKSLHRYVMSSLRYLVSLYDIKQKRFGWNRSRNEAVRGDKHDQEGAPASGYAPEGQEIRCQVVYHTSNFPRPSRYVFITASSRSYIMFSLGQAHSRCTLCNCTNCRQAGGGLTIYFRSLLQRKLIRP